MPKNAAAQLDNFTPKTGTEACLIEIVSQGKSTYEATNFHHIRQERSIKELGLSLIGEQVIEVVPFGIISKMDLYWIALSLLWHVA